jgi:ribosomal protein S18 acetylase RimI-like enzyme
MTEGDFHSYLERAVAEYAEEHVRGGRWSAEEALEQSRKEYAELLPAGVASPDQYLYTLMDTSTQTPVGMLWYALQSPAGQPVAFIYDVSVDPAFRRRGYATQAFRALEEQVRSQGVQQIRLHVFGHNHEARALYEKLGFTPTNILMAKTLGDQDSAEPPTRE